MILNTNFSKIYFKILNFFIKFSIKTKLISNDISNNQISKKTKFLYILHKYSIIDLLILRNQCIKNKLNDPLLYNKFGNNNLPSYIFIKNKKNKFFNIIFKKKNTNQLKSFKKYLKIYNKNEKNIQILLVYITYKNNNKTKKTFKNILIKKLKNFFMLILFKKDKFVYFSNKISLNKILSKSQINDCTIKKFIRIINIYYIKQNKAFSKQKNIYKNNILKKILKLKIIQYSILNKKKTKNIINNIKLILNEISAHISCEFIQIADKLLKFFFKKKYKKINIKNIEKIKKLTYLQHTIIYIPSHKSHIDYLLLSYILYNHGLFPPYIAAGINLNFFPFGFILRRLGAFFIKRSFSGKKIYSVVLKKYLQELIHNNCSLEYFIEGERSRTGRLLFPKSGILSMTLQAILQKINKKISIIPVYIDYESILEIQSYKDEINSIRKSQKSYYSILKNIFKKHKFGKIYVNFGKPIFLKKYLKHHESIYKSNISHSKNIFINEITKKISYDIMIKINNLVIINPINLCSIILFNSKEKTITLKNIIIQINFYLKLINIIKNFNYIFISENDTKSIIKYSLKSKIFNYLKNKNTKNIKIFIQKKTIANYSQNNILHLFIIPSLIINIILYNNFSKRKIIKIVTILYPIVKNDFFLKYKINEIFYILNNLITKLEDEKFLLTNKNKKITINKKYYNTLKVISNNAKNTLIIYTIAFLLIKISPNIQETALIRQMLFITKQISKTHKITSIDFSHKSTLLRLIKSIKIAKYFHTKNKTSFTKEIIKIYNITKTLIPKKIYKSIIFITKNLNIKHK